MTVTGKPLCWPSSPELKGAAADGDECVVLTLPEGAGVTVDLGL